jgi:serine protease AprX
MQKIILIVFISFSLVSFSQEEDAWVYFNAKPNAATFLSNPLTMLTQRSLDRRTLQNIPLDNKDVPVHQPYIDQIEAADGITVFAKSKWLNAVHVRGLLEEIQALQTLPFVSNVDFANKLLNNAPRNSAKREPVQSRTINKNLETEIIFNYGNSANQIQMLGGHLLHQQNFTGSGKIIAVLDNGFAGVDNVAPFARLRSTNKILGGYNYVNRDANVYTNGSHGTNVLSNMGGYIEGQLVGTAPDASYYLFVTEDNINEWPLEESLWVEAAEEADRLGVDVINTSLGYTTFNNPTYDHTYEDMDGQTTFISRGLNEAFSRGMICVNSAGNSGSSDWFYISAPADALNAFSIGAVNATGVIAGFSSRGPSVDGRIKPDVCAQGVAAVVATLNGSIGTASGTSFSSPITAGMVASLWQALPNKTNVELLQIIKESASQFANPDNEYGYGIPNYYQAFLNANLGTTSLPKTDFKIYPNPIKNSLSVTLPDNLQNGTIEIYNQLGQLVFNDSISKTFSNYQFSDFESGIYIYKIATTNFSKSGKLIKD